MCINAYSRCGPRHRHSRDVLHVAQPPVHVQVEVILQHGPNPAINLLYGSSCCSVHNSIAQGQSAREGTDRPGIPLLTADNTQAAAFWQSSAAPPALCAGPPKNVTKWYWLPSPPPKDKGYLLEPPESLGRTKDPHMASIPCYIPSSQLSCPQPPAAIQHTRHSHPQHD